MKIFISFYSVLLKPIYFYIPQFYTLQISTAQRKRYMINLALQVSSKDKDNEINGAGETLTTRRKNKVVSELHIIH